LVFRNSLTIEQTLVFGDVMPLSYVGRPEQLVQDVAAKMQAAGLYSQGTTTDWTKILKRSLWELLHSEGTDAQDVLFSDTEADNHEFLLDVVVWDRSDGEGATLVVESEWTQHKADIIEDFWKLLVVKAPMKHMVFGLNKAPRVHTSEAVWNQKGEQYVFINFAPAPARRAWWMEIPEDGRLEEIPKLTEIVIP
jgi:hypothetical protein